MSELRTIDKRGALILPAELRAGVSLVEIVRRPDGVIELRPKAVIDQAQAWFWGERWQAMEHEAEDDVASGRIQRFADTDALIAALDSSAASSLSPERHSA